MVSRKLGPYAIHEALGRGGMGTVYRGVEDTNGREVAVKVLSPTLVSDAGFRERFKAEIQSLEQLSHPNIVELFGFGEQDGQLFYAMELVRGASLQEEIAAGRRFGWREVIGFGKQVCAALKHAHDHGVIHRDIKPANLILDEQDRLQLTDFGIAKLFGSSSHTIDGGVLGTADYMSPEQADGVNVTPRSDLYSLGAVLYALLAGRPPFQGSSLPEVIHKAKFEPPLPVRRFAPDTPEQLETLIEVLLAKDPQQRIPTALALSKRMCEIEEALSIDEPNRKPPDRPPEPADRPAADEELLSTLETAAVTPDYFQQETEDQATISIVESDAPESTSTNSQFTPVDSSYRQRLQIDSDNQHSVTETIGTWLALLALLTGVSWAIWHFSRPPTSDQLFDQIEQSASTGGYELIEVWDEIETFLATFPDDQRRQQVLEWQSAAELARLTRRLETLARAPIDSANVTGTEWLVIEAIRSERTDPAKARRQFAAITNMFGHDEPLSASDKQCLSIAKRRAAALAQASDSQRTRSQQALLAERIKTARQLLTDDPQTAQTILQAVIDFYENEPWAEDFVQEARGLLRQPPPSSS